MYCQHCGSLIPENASSCQRCIESKQISLSQNQETAFKLEMIQSRKIFYTFKNVPTRLTINSNTHNSKFDIIFTDCGCIFMPTSNYTSLNDQVGPLLLQASVYIFNKIQHKNNSKQFSLDMLGSMLKDGEAVLIENPNIKLHQIEKRGIFERIGLEESGCRFIVSGKFITSGGIFQGNAIWQVLGSAKSQADYFKSNAYTIELSDELIPREQADAGWRISSR